MVPVLLLTVHGHVHSIDGSECRSWGSPWLPVLPKGSTCPSGRGGSVSWGVGRFDDVIGAWARRKLSPEASIMPEASLQGSGEIEFVVRVLSS
jgi:hypothetical protein